MERLELVIVGAGSAGLATAALLRKDGIESVLLEAGPEPGAAWRTRYDRLRLHTPRLLSGLPGLRMPRRHGRWVRRDGLLEYFHAYVDAHGLDVRTNMRAERLEPDGDGGWWVETARGQIQAKTVIVATGYNGRPFIPDWPGRESFAGELIHSSQYVNPAPFRDRDVLVVGVGNSGAEIATDVADGGASRSRLSVRTPPQILRRATAGIPAQLIDRDPQGAARLGRSDLEDAAAALDSRSRGAGPAAPGGRRAHVIHHDRHDTGARRRHRQRGAPRTRRGRRGGRGLRRRRRAARRRLALCARRSDCGDRVPQGLDELVGHLGVTRAEWLPVKTDGEPVLPGLWFVGFTPTLGGQLREGSIAARHVAAAVAASI